MTNKEIKSILEALPKKLSYNCTCKCETNYQLNIEKLNLPGYNVQKTLTYNVLYLMDSVGDDYTNKNDPPNIKYTMFVFDENNEAERDNELYVVIGQNPSCSSDKNIDRTNQCIYKALISKGIHRYLLLNTFPIIDADGINSPDTLKADANIDIVKSMLESLVKQVTIKFIYACGSSLPVYARFLNDINEFATKNNLNTYAFEYEGNPHTHMSIQTINSKKIDITALKIEKYIVKCVNLDEFKNAKFIKGESE